MSSEEINNDPRMIENENEEESGERRVQNRINDAFRIFVNRLLPVNDDENEIMDEENNHDVYEDIDQIENERIGNDEEVDSNDENNAENDNENEVNYFFWKITINFPNHLKKIWKYTFVVQSVNLFMRIN